MLIQRGSLVLIALSFLSGVCAAQVSKSDDVTQKLFEQYIVRQAKVNTESVMAATLLVAERGRETGFWKTVVEELKRNNQHSEIGCVRVLGKMLAVDAAARDAIKRQKETGEISAWVPSVCLDSEVVAELIKRGTKADRFRIDHYTIALARARVPEAGDFFRTVLRADRATNPTTTEPNTYVPNGPFYMDSTRFHAAVGLAQLGDMEGIDWLIANSEYTEGTVTNAAPRGAPPGGSLHACCAEALRHLSGERSKGSKAEWTEWAKSIGNKKSPVIRTVVFSDP
jgi:hypothetical protein